MHTLRRLRPHSHPLRRLPATGIPRSVGPARRNGSPRRGGRPASGCVLPCGVHAAAAIAAIAYQNKAAIYDILFTASAETMIAISSLPAAENLVWGLSVSRKNSPCTESFCHVIRLHCGTAALLLGCAERSEPRSRVRRAEGAGLDRECADRATISLPRRTNVQRALFDLLLFCRFSFHRHASFRSLKIRFDMIRGELAIGRGNRATTLYSVDPRGSVP